MPRVNSTNGATQQSEPTIAANALAHNCLVAVCMQCSLHHLLTSAGARNVTQRSAEVVKARCQGGLQRNPLARGGEIGPCREQAGEPGPTARCAAGLSSGLRSTSWRSLPDHR